jgi:hypothetical protein
MLKNATILFCALAVLFVRPVYSQLHSNRVAFDSVKFIALKSQFNVASHSQNYNEAINILRQMMAIGVADSSMYYKLAMITGLSGDKAEGKKYLDTAISLGWDVNSDGGSAIVLLGYRSKVLDSVLIDPVAYFVRIRKEAAMDAKLLPTGFENRVLYRMYYEDQHDRSPAVQLLAAHLQTTHPKYLTLLSDEDNKRRKMIYRLLSRKLISTPFDLQEAALILQHGNDTTDYWTAHELALQSVQMGNADAKWLAAATLDRYLLTKGQPQKYGTQSITDDKTGQLELYKVDPTVTDSERALWNVPPIKNARDLYRKK